MAKAEGRIYKFDAPDKIETRLLEVIAYKGGQQLIECKTSEFSAVCPFSGLPDIGTIIIQYVPRKKIVELKSLKYYFVSFRNIGITQEDATNRIFTDLKNIIKPSYLKISVAYNTRGGIDTICTMEHGKKKASGE